MRIYDARLGKFLSVDPLASQYAYYSPYQFAGLNPIRYVDLDGLEPADLPLYHLNQELGKIQGSIEGVGTKIKTVTSDFVEDVKVKLASADKTIEGWLSKYGIVTFGEGQAEDESHLRKRTPEMNVDVVDKDALELIMKKLRTKLPSADPAKRRSDQMKKYMEEGAKKKLREENIKNVTKEGKKMLQETAGNGSSSQDVNNKEFDVMINDTLFKHKVENGKEKVDTVPQQKR